MPEAAVAGVPPALPPLYYLHNFETLWRVVQERYADLLWPQELAQMRRFEALPQPARCLFVRLVLRRGPEFRVSRLRYAEIDDLDSALAALLKSGLAGECEALDTGTLARLFTRAEIHQCHAVALAGLSLPTKPALLAAVSDLGETDELRARRLCDTLHERLIRVSGGDTLALLQLLFFGNSRQSLVDFVLTDLGLATYWPYPLSRAQRVFDSREAVEAYRQADALAERHAQWQETRDTPALAALAGEALALDCGVDAVARRVHRVCNRIARDCERADLAEPALALYARSEQHPARERRLRVLESRGALQEALALAGDVLAAPWSEGEKAAVSTIRQRLLRRVHGTRSTRSRDRFPTRTIQLPQNIDSVERAAARALQAEGWLQAQHVENALFNGLFGLAFWDELFAAVPGAFHHPFQAGPADMFSSRFQARRNAALERRLRQLAACDLKAELLAAHTRCAGYQCRWVDWRVITPALVQHATRCIPFRHLVAAWRRLLFDPRENRRGQPDLVALGEHAGEYHLWEVKGPGDALQPHQRRWLNYLCEIGAPAGVLKVVWIDA